MRTVATCGGLFLLLLVFLLDAAFVVARRSPDAGPSPASSPLPSSGSGPDATGRDAGGHAALGHGARGPDPPLPGPSASRPLAHAGGPVESTGLALACGDVDLGDVDPEERLHVEVPWRRTGDGVLRVREVRTACGCLAATGLAGDVLPGAEGALALDLHVPRRPGPFDLSIQVLTDRPPDDVARIDVLGFSGHEVSVDPAALDLGSVPLGRRVQRLVSVRLPDAVPDGAIRARLVDLVGSVSVHPPMQPGRREGLRRERGAELLVSPSAEAIGPIEGVLEISIGDAPARSVPLRGRVESR